MLAIVFNYEEMAKETALERMGVIYHEVSHTVTHVFEFIGEDDSKIGDESRSYLGEHIFKQVFFVELKTATGKLSPRQELVFDDLGEAGFPVHVLHSKDDVEDFIREATTP
jgi:hypothetical protein